MKDGFDPGSGATAPAKDMDYRYAAFMGFAPKHIPNWEFWSCPDAETYITGIEYYEHPRLCRLRMKEIYPFLELPIPDQDQPIPRPDETTENSANSGHRVRWGDGESWIWDWGNHFKSAEDVFLFSPLEQADFTNIPVVESRDYSDEEKLYKEYRSQYPAEWGDEPPEGEAICGYFYNTLYQRTMKRGTSRSHRNRLLPLR